MPGHKTIRLTYPQIENSPEISEWLFKFGGKRLAALDMLMRLRFVEESTFSTWLRSELLGILDTGSVAVYAVRKLKKDVDCIWDDEGRFRTRPGHSLGSEDLIQGFVANLSKNNSTLHDHPSIKTIKTQRIQQVVLLDDSIGSGSRVAGFIKRMFTNKTFLSRWSFGKIRIFVVAFARMLDAEENIIAEVKGSNHPIRKYPAHSKIKIRSLIASRQNHLSQRWGPHYQKTLDLCDACEGVIDERKRGYGNTMANLVFAHSIPNNLPGLLWFQSDSWDALFPQRTVPLWLYPLLRSEQSLPYSVSPRSESTATPAEVALLRVVKKGLRRESTIAWRLGLDVVVVRQLLVTAVGRGLLTPNHRITEAGRSLIKQDDKPEQNVYNRELYRPKSWCADQTVQPPALDREGG